MAKAKFTKNKLNMAIGLATRTIYYNLSNPSKVSVPDFCKVLGITQSDIQKMNKKIKQLNKDKNARIKNNH